MKSVVHIYKSNLKVKLYVKSVVHIYKSNLKVKLYVKSVVHIYKSIFKVKPVGHIFAPMKDQKHGNSHENIFETLATQ